MITKKQLQDYLAHKQKLKYSLARHFVTKKPFEIIHKFSESDIVVKMRDDEIISYDTFHELLTPDERAAMRHYFIRQEKCSTDEKRTSTYQFILMWQKDYLVSDHSETSKQPDTILEVSSGASPNQQNKSPFVLLPDELLIIIFNSLHITNIAALLLTCRRFEIFINDESFTKTKKNWLETKKLYKEYQLERAPIPYSFINDTNGINYKTWAIRDVIMNGNSYKKHQAFFESPDLQPSLIELKPLIDRFGEFLKSTKFSEKIRKNMIECIGVLLERGKQITDEDITYAKNAAITSGHNRYYAPLIQMFEKAKTTQAILAQNSECFKKYF